MQENEISEKINSEGGNEPIREDHGTLRDKQPTKETMSKENTTEVPNKTVND